MESQPPTEGERRTLRRQQQAVADFGRRALAADTVDRLLADAATTVADTLDAEYSAVLESLPGEGRLLLREGVGWRDGLVSTASLPADGETQVASTLDGDDPVVVADLAESEYSSSSLLTDHDVGGGVTVAVGPSEDPWGVLGVHASEAREFTDADGQFLRNVADVLAAAIARLDREGERRRRERRFEAVFEDPNLLVVLLDPDGTVLDANGTALEYVDGDRGGVTGLPFWETPWWDGGAAEEVREYVERAADGEYVEFEGEIAGSSERPAVSGGFRPVRDDDGEVVSIIVSSRDVTERRVRERALEESEQRYRALIEHFPNGAVALVDADLRYRTVGGTPLEAAAATADEVAGQPVREAVPPSLAEELVPRYEAAFEGESSTFEIESGGRFYRFQIVPVRDGDGEVFAAMGMSQDLTDHAETERKLAESERRYRTLVENFPNGSVGLFDDDLEYTAVGGQLLDDLDLDPEDRVGRSIRDIHPDDLLDEIGPYFEVALTGEASSFEVEYHGRHLSATTLPIGDGDDVEGGMLVVQDVTERRERERKLEESEAMFRLLAENLEEMVWLSDPVSREIDYLNPAFEDIWGREREELYDDPTSFLESVHPDDRQRVREAYEAMPRADFEEEYRIVRPDGDVRWIDVRAGAVSYEGRSRVVGIAEDVTERRERERKLEESERRYRTLVEDFPNGAVAMFDENLEYTAVGGQLVKAEGVDPEERIGHSIRELYPDDILEEVVPHLEAALDGESITFTTEYIGRHLYNQTMPVRDADDEVFAGMLVVQDVTDRREYERKLEASNERLEQFAYAASHDLQEPLRMVTSYLQLLESRYVDHLEDDAQEFIGYAVDGAERMREMIDALLEYSRVDTRGDPFESVDLDGVLENVRQDLRMKIEESDAEITSSELPVVQGDVSQLRQVFQNLLSNAMEYSGDDPPRVHVSAAREGDRWVVAVEDEGIGIDPEHTERVFEVFQRLHSRGDHDGTGIGLALCERIVERHGGDIWVESEPGEGSTFRFTLPAVDA